MITTRSFRGRNNTLIIVHWLLSSSRVHLVKGRPTSSNIVKIRQHQNR